MIFFVNITGNSKSNHVCALGTFNGALLALRQRWLQNGEGIALKRS